MSTAAVVANDLRKHYGSTIALDDLSFEIASGTVTGFLGPNGAGKTTTFRVLLGLAGLDGGSATVGGRRVPGQMAEIVKHVGAIVDEPGLLRPLTGRQNMTIAAHTLGFGHHRIDELVDFVELTADIDRPVQGYSKGMRQRLALAAAMVGDPEILFLDEPLDGLDPAGQHTLKRRLRQLAERDGRTVIISSHDLADVQALADDVVVIARGSLRFQGALSDLIGRARGIGVTVDDQARAEQVLKGAGFEVEDQDGQLMVASSDGAAIVRTLSTEGLYPSAVVPMAVSLESAFLEITGEQT
ncbi:MAG: ABC transporter ATP-binding protein [Acidimicrobiia bacterium]